MFKKIKEWLFGSNPTNVTPPHVAGLTTIVEAPYKIEAPVAEVAPTVEVPAEPVKKARKPRAPKAEVAAKPAKKAAVSEKKPAAKRGPKPKSNKA